MSGSARPNLTPFLFDHQVSGRTVESDAAEDVQGQESIAKSHGWPRRLNDHRRLIAKNDAAYTQLVDQHTTDERVAAKR
jgi:hypothetical protein